MTIQIVHAARRKDKILRRLAMIVLILVAAQSAHAQDEDERTRISAAEFQSHLVELDLPVAQREAAEAMFADYSREFDDALSMHRKLLNWVWANPPDSFSMDSPRELSQLVWVQQQATRERWERGARALEARYFARLHAIAIGLDEVVELFRRQHLRERVLKYDFGFNLTGASTDLIALVSKVDSAILFRPPAQQILCDYELAVDHILQPHDEVMITHRTDTRSASDAVRTARRLGQDLAGPAAALADSIAQPAHDGVLMWDLTAATSEQLIGALTPLEAARFRDALASEMHPYLRPDKGSTPEQAFDAALARNDLSEDQRSRLESLRESYCHKRDVALPELHKTFMGDPATERETFIMLFTVRKEEAEERQNAQTKTWEEAKGGWLKYCKKVRDEIDAIFGEKTGTNP